MPSGQVPPRASSVVAVVRNGKSYSFSRRLRGSVRDKVLKCIKHCAHRNSSSALSGLWDEYHDSDLAPSDFHVFLHFKKFLSSGERFGNDKELKTSVTRWFNSQAAEYYFRVIQKLIPRFD
ncbi:hypothetical protein TNCV_4614041 [Trichonephila clavipes]|nr:hypothetical protein TNCV_4614041 [Trichonephila clavipes]